MNMISAVMSGSKRIIGICVPVLVLTVAVVEGASNILLLNIPARSPGYYSAALDAGGYTFTETGNVADFQTALTNGTDWDLVLVDNYDGFFDDGALISLMNYIAQGGRCVLNYYDTNWALADTFGAEMQQSDYSYTTPISVLRWEPENPLLTTPNVIPDLTPEGEESVATVDGFYLQPRDDATAVAGYTQTETDYQAAIIIGNGGRTILLGITPELFGADMEKLLENCIEYFLTPPPTPTPALSVTCSSLTPAVGDTFTVDVTVQPITQVFDAWGCIFGSGSVAYSFRLGGQAGLRKGTEPLVTSVPGLSRAYTIRLLDLKLPPRAAGDYTIVVELVPAGLVPLIPIEGYRMVKEVTVQ
jgi:hypothetical protein